jgi:hypothetical protein
MGFRLVEGRGPFGLSRWIQASGEIHRDTAAHFEAFARSRPVRGTTVALEGLGGNSAGGRALGRALRAAGVHTTIGASVVRREQGRDIATLVTHNVQCSSACAFAFLGGVERRLARTARFGVHQFVWPDPPRELTPQMAFSVAQTISGQIVEYLHELGIDPRLFSLSVTQMGRVRVLTRDELERLGIAVLPPAETEERAVSWSAGISGDVPMLYRRDTRLSDASMRIDQETFAICYGDRYFIGVRVVLGRLAPGASLRMDAIEIDVAGHREMRPVVTGEGERATEPDASLAIPFEISREALVAAAAQGRLSVRLSGDLLESTAEIGAGLAEILPDFLASCDAMQNRYAAR